MGVMDDDHSEGPDLRAARVAGLAAAVAALVVLWAISRILTSAPFPPQAVGERVLRLVPGDVATFFIEAFGHWARRLLSLGATVASAWLGAEAAAAAARRGASRFALPSVALGALAWGAALSSPAPAAGLLASAGAAVVAAAVYAGVAGSLYDGLTRAPDEGRRRALRTGFGMAAGIVFAGGALGWAARRLAGPNTDVALVAPESPVVPPADGSFPAIPGLAAEITSVHEHYVVDINLVQPSVEADTWSLRVHGLVDSPLELGFDELQRRFDVVEQYACLTCVSNEVGGGLVGNSAWGGVRLGDVLEHAGVREGAVDVVFRAADGYSDSITIEDALDPNVLLAVSQNGRPLTQDHGFPCRVRIPKIYGMKNVKWLEDIEVVSSDYQGYWQTRGWSDDAVVKTASRIDDAGDEDRKARRGRATWVAGVAWAGDRGIAEVEVSTDGGETWEQARLKDEASPNSWRVWAYRWTPAVEGTATVMCRARDGDGALQSPEPAPPHPDGADGYHRVEVDVT
jgi:DMSO/TMAO reductase YedYZ molybdopterin-dependent catalytic subunit